MRRYLLDTNAASDCIFRRKGVHDRVKAARAQRSPIGIGIPVLAELYGGVEYSSSREKNLAILERNVNLWPFTDAAAKIYGRLFAEMRRKGQSIQQIDLQIAAIALTLGNCTIVTSDSDLSAVPGLSVENWASRK